MAALATADVHMSDSESDHEVIQKPPNMDEACWKILCAPVLSAQYAHSKAKKAGYKTVKKQRDRVKAAKVARKEACEKWKKEHDRTSEITALIGTSAAAQSSGFARV